MRREEITEEKRSIEALKVIQWSEYRKIKSNFGGEEVLETEGAEEN